MQNTISLFYITLTSKVFATSIINWPTKQNDIAKPIDWNYNISCNN